MLCFKSYIKTFIVGFSLIFVTDKKSKFINPIFLIIFSNREIVVEFSVTIFFQFVNRKYEIGHL